MRVVVCALTAALLLSGCSHDKDDDSDKAAEANKPITASSDASSEAILKKDCSDPKWKEQNLGLWYSVCRQPLRW